VSTPEDSAGDRRIDEVIGRLLQTGVLAAAAVVILGAVMLLTQRGGTTASYSSFHGAPDALRSLRGIARSAAALDSAGIIQLGLVLLIATPVARVALTLVAFAMRRDRIYTILTGLVLALLLFGLVS
jgi:uncharacterized membrane protein